MIVVLFLSYDWSYHLELCHSLHRLFVTRYRTEGSILFLSLGVRVIELGLGLGARVRIRIRVTG
jgi:hypothetical protein